MTETKINSAILDKFSKTVINRVKSDIPDITGKTIDGHYLEAKNGKDFLMVPIR